MDGRVHLHETVTDPRILKFPESRGNARQLDLGSLALQPDQGQDRIISSKRQTPSDLTDRKK